MSATKKITPFYDAYQDYDIPKMVAAARPVAAELLLEGLSNQLFDFEGGAGLDSAVARLVGESGADLDQRQAERTAALAIGIVFGQLGPGLFATTSEDR